MYSIRSAGNDLRVLQTLYLFCVYQLFFFDPETMLYLVPTYGIGSLVGLNEDSTLGVVLICMYQLSFFNSETLLYLVHGIEFLAGLNVDSAF